MITNNKPELTFVILYGITPYSDVSIQRVCNIKGDKLTCSEPTRIEIAYFKTSLTSKWLVTLFKTNFVNYYELRVYDLPELVLVKNFKIYMKSYVN